MHDEEPCISCGFGEQSRWSPAILTVPKQADEGQGFYVRGVDHSARASEEPDEKQGYTVHDDGCNTYVTEDEDNVVIRPAHYTRFNLEPVTFIMRNHLPFHTGNIIKYACRAGHKLYDGQDATQSEITDLEKVRRYAEMRINQLKGETEL